MERIKFVLINPTSPARRAKTGERPASSRVFRFSMLPSLCVAASMPPHVDTRIVDEDIEPIDYDVDADLVGITFMTYNAPRAYEIARRFREDKGMPVIVGGYHPTLMLEEAAQYADAVCVGDAEPSVPRMIDDFSAGRLQPVYECAPAPLSNLPVPRRDLIRRQDYAPIDVVQATRDPAHYKMKELAPLIEYGGSPRASIFLGTGARAIAFLNGRGFVTPQDVKDIAYDVLRHRVILTYEAEAEQTTPEEVIQTILTTVPVP